MNEPFANLSFSLPAPVGRDDSPIVTDSILGPFGITAEVPSFAEVIEWQEKKRTLDQGYYRLIHPPRVEELRRRLDAHYPDHTAVLFTSPQLALKEWVDFSSLHGAEPSPVDPDEAGWSGMELLLRSGLRLQAGAPVLLHDRLPDEVPDHVEVLIGRLADESIDIEAGVVLLRGEEMAGLFYERNRRRGGVVSGRNVAWFTGEDRSQEILGEADREGLGEALCKWEQAEAAFFYPSGMQAVTVCLDLARSEGHGHFIVLGHVYRDTHILLEEMEWAGQKVSVSFLERDALEELDRLLASRPDTAAVFIETVTNPHVEAPDLPLIAERAHAAGIPLIVDSTMATPVNCQPLVHGADLVIHSTTKYFSGSNQHGGGVVLVRDSQWVKRLQKNQESLGNVLSVLEYAGLHDGMATFAERMERFEFNGRRVREFLDTHPAVDTVYPVQETPPAHLKGWGSVVSCTLKDSSREALGRFFDAPMPGIRKAPSLGSDQTLFCPYVLLTYFDKDDAYLAEYGLPRHLIRIAVGCETEIEPVLHALGDALERSLS